MTMLALQAGATFRLALRRDPLAERVLGVLGSAMVVGYLVEREFRGAMTPSGWDRAVTPVVGVGAGLAPIMAGLGLDPVAARRRAANAAATPSVDG